MANRGWVSPDSRHSYQQHQEARTDSRAEFVVNEHSNMHNFSSSMPQIIQSQQKIEYFDIVLVCSKNAVQARNKFISFCDTQKWKVYLPSKEKILGEDEFSSFNRGHHHSTYIVILLTPCFKQDVWAVSRFQIALKNAIEERRLNVIPVLFGDSSIVPFELTAIASIKHDDEFFAHVMKRTIKTENRILCQKRYDESCSLQLTEVGQQSIDDAPMEADLQVDVVDRGSTSYADVFNVMSTELLPGKTSERYLNTHQFQALCRSLDIPSPNLNGDWRGLAESLELESAQIQSLESNSMKPGFSASKQILDVYFFGQKHLDKSSVLSNLNEMFIKMNFGRGIQITQEALET